MGWLAVLIALAILGGTIAVGVIYYNNGDISEWWILMLVILGGIVVAGVCFIIFFYIILAALTPGDNPGLVEDGDKAITKVNAVNVTFEMALSPSSKVTLAAFTF